MDLGLFWQPRSGWTNSTYRPQEENLWNPSDAVVLFKISKIAQNPKYSLYSVLTERFSVPLAGVSFPHTNQSEESGKTLVHFSMNKAPCAVTLTKAAFNTALLTTTHSSWKTTKGSKYRKFLWCWRTRSSHNAALNTCKSSFFPKLVTGVKASSCILVIHYV